MAVPKLQFACDQNSLAEAVADVEKIADVVDIVEVGTVLLLQEGKEAIHCLRNMAPDKILAVDPKCVDAGAVVAGNCARAGADCITVVCAASIDTMRAAAGEVKWIQIELFGDWTFSQAEEWRKAGFTQVVYHQSRDGAAAGWGERDLNRVKRLVEMGFQVSVTGGISRETLHLFADVEVYCFIVGRAISKAENPRQAALDFREELHKIWKEDDGR